MSIKDIFIAKGHTEPLGRLDRLDGRTEPPAEVAQDDASAKGGPKASRVVTGGFNDIGTVTGLLAAGLAAIDWDGGYSTLTPTRLLFQLDAGGAA